MILTIQRLNGLSFEREREKIWRYNGYLNGLLTFGWAKISGRVRVTIFSNIGGRVQAPILIGRVIVDAYCCKA